MCTAELCVISMCHLIILHYHRADGWCSIWWQNQQIVLVQHKAGRIKVFGAQVRVWAQWAFVPLSHREPLPPQLGPFRKPTGQDKIVFCSSEQQNKLHKRKSVCGVPQGSILDSLFILIYYIIILFLFVFRKFPIIAIQIILLWFSIEIMWSIHPLSACSTDLWHSEALFLNFSIIKQFCKCAIWPVEGEFRVYVAGSLTAVGQTGLDGWLVWLRLVLTLTKSTGFDPFLHRWCHSGPVIHHLDSQRRKISF